MILLHVWKAIDQPVHLPLTFFCNIFSCSVGNFVFKKFWAVFKLMVKLSPHPICSADLPGRSHVTACGGETVQDALEPAGVIKCGRTAGIWTRSGNLTHQEHLLGAKKKLIRRLQV